jgi:hypothetical protein
MVELVGREVECQEEVKLFVGFHANFSSDSALSRTFRGLFTPSGWIFASQANYGGKLHSAKPRPLVAVHNGKLEG